MRRILIAAGLALAAAPVFAEETGQQAYMVACAVCHGESAMGDGPFAPLLNIQTPNLTTLAQANDGVFPFLDVLMIVDGRTGVRAHGDSAMPVWGEIFSDSASNAGPYGSEVIARGRLLSLVYYLELIQE